MAMYQRDEFRRLRALADRCSEKYFISDDNRQMSRTYWIEHHHEIVCGPAPFEVCAQYLREHARG
jgi:hypothetical protein